MKKKQLKKIVTMALCAVIMAVSGSIFTITADGTTGGEEYFYLNDGYNTRFGEDGVITIGTMPHSWLFFSVESAVSGISFQKIIPKVVNNNIADVVEGTPAYYIQSNIKQPNTKAKWYIEHNGKNPGITKFVITAEGSDKILRTREYTLVHATGHVGELNLSDMELFVEKDSLEETEKEFIATNEKNEKVYFGSDDISFNGKKIYDGKYVSISMEKDGTYHVKAKDYGTEAIEIQYDNMAGFFTYLPNAKGEYKEVVYEPITKKISISVCKNIESMSFTKSTMKMEVGEEIEQKPAIIPENHVTENFLWTSSDTSVATVDEKGNVVAKNSGTARITVQSTDTGKVSAFYTVTVRANAPKNVRAKIVNRGVKLSWEQVPAIKDYKIYRATEINGNYKAIGTVKGLSYVDSDLVYGTKYYYGVIAVPTEGQDFESDYSSRIRIKPMPLSPKVSKVVKKKRGRYKITLSGNQYTGFVIYAGRKKKTKNQPRILTTKRGVVSLKMKKHMYVRARAYIKVGNKMYYSDYSKPYRFARL